MFFVPWWWIVWTSGKRFSLRRSITSTMALIVLLELVVAGVRYAVYGQTPTASIAKTVAGWTALSAVAYALCEPIVLMAADCLRARAWRPDRLRDLSYGMQTAYAVALALGAYVLAAHIAPLGRLLVRARSDSGFYGGSARYIVGATIVMLPIVIVTRGFLMRVRFPAFRAQPQRRRTAMQNRLEAPPILPIVSRPARIVRMDVGPAEARDDR